MKQRQWKSGMAALSNINCVQFSIIGPPHHKIKINNQIVQLSKTGILELNDIFISSIDDNEQSIIVDYILK